MSWAIGYDERWQRDIGYGVPSHCDHFSCKAEIDRGLGYVCGGDVYGGEHGCGLFFCSQHRYPTLCQQCTQDKPPFTPTADTPEWIAHKLTDESWKQWRDEHPDEVCKLKGGR